MIDEQPGEKVVASFPANVGYSYRAELHGVVWRILQISTPSVSVTMNAGDPITPQEKGIRDPAYWIARSKAVAR